MNNTHVCYVNVTTVSTEIRFTNVWAENKCLNLTWRVVNEGGQNWVKT